VAQLHVVVQGEHLHGIADRYGFLDPRTIWDHPSNAELKAQRENASVLFPGDELFIPDKEQKQVGCSTDRSHRFVIKRPKLRVRLVVEDLYEHPVANAACVLQIDGRKLELTTDADGAIDVAVRADATQATLTIQDQQTAITDLVIPVLIGHLDPVTEVEGQRERLNNLGYFAGPLPGQDEEQDRLTFLSAVEEFQCDHGLHVDGKCGPQTQAKLLQVHGC
jgi:N-acetylmuramoyl-L-alanine amidase